MCRDKIIGIEIGLIALFAVGVAFKLARAVLVPFAMALLLAYAVSPVLDHLVKKKVPKSLALTVILILTFVVLYLVGSVFYSSGKSFALQLPAYNEVVDSFIESVDELFHSERIKTDMINFFTAFNIERAGKVLLSALGPFVSFVSELFLVIIFMIFILAGRGRLAGKIERAFAPGRAAAIGGALSRIDRDIQKYLAVKTLTNLVLGLVTAVVMALFGLPFAVLFGILTFLVNYIPTLGTLLGVAATALFAAFMFGSVGRPLLILLILTVVSFLIDRLLRRKLMGDVIELSPLLVLFALFFGAWLWGIPGMILAVPFLAMVKIVLANVPGLVPIEKMMGK